MSGVLYVVATPIGNLEDLTLRAARILRSVSLVACEDTRQTHKLMDSAAAATPLISLHEFNERDRTQELLERLASGQDIALVSDAGTPLISDPGYRLVEAAIAAGIAVSPIPGPSAVLSALSVSGLPTDAFAFIGFLPHKTNPRRQLLEKWKDIPATLVFFESPHRILESLSDLAELFPNRRVVLARELTKIHEEILRGSALELRTKLSARAAIKGEFTCVLERADLSKQTQIEATSATIAQMVDQLILSGLSRMDAIKEAGKRAGLSKREAYALLEENKA